MFVLVVSPGFSLVQTMTTITTDNTQHTTHNRQHTTDGHSCRGLPFGDGLIILVFRFKEVIGYKQWFHTYLRISATNYSSKVTKPVCDWLSYLVEIGHLGWQGTLWHPPGWLCSWLDSLAGLPGWLDSWMYWLDSWLCWLDNHRGQAAGINCVQVTCHENMPEQAYSQIGHWNF